MADKVTLPVTEDPDPPRTLPERNLLAAVLARAFCDLKGPHASERRKAEAWIRSKSRKEWTFAWVCYNLDLDPKEILKNLRKINISRLKAGTR